MYNVWIDFIYKTLGNVSIVPGWRAAVLTSMSGAMHDVSWRRLPDFRWRETFCWPPLPKRAVADVTSCGKARSQISASVR